MKQYPPIDQPNVKAKIIGAILIIIGVILLFNPTSLNIKIGFASILIGLFMVVMITKKSIPQKISDDQLEGNLDAVKKIIEELNLDGNAVFLPKSDTLTEERILIPPNKSGVIKIPNITNDDVFLIGIDGKNLGVTLPPSGLKILKEMDKRRDLENWGLENIENKLQTFIGMNLLKSVSFTKKQSGYKLELEEPIFCPHDKKLCQQYPCPTCSAILTAITRTSKKKLWINSTTHNGKKTTFHLNFIKRRTEKRNENC